MDDQTPDQQLDQSVKPKLEKDPSKSPDPKEIADELANQLKAEQEEEIKHATRDRRRVRDELLSNKAAERAGVLISTSPNQSSADNSADTENNYFNSTNADSPEEIPSESVAKPLIEETPSKEQTPSSEIPPSPEASPSSIVTATNEAVATALKAPQSPTPAPATTSKTSESQAPQSFSEKIKEFLSSIFSGGGGGFFEKIQSFISKLFGNKTEAKTEEVSPANVTPVPPSTPTEVPSIKVEGADSTAGLKGKALFDNPEFQARTDQIAAKIGVSRADLYAIFKMESGGDPQIQNSIGATGLIQWVPRYAPIPVSEIKKLTGLQQLDWVEKYFGNRKLHSFSDLYRVVFWPDAIGKGPDYIFGDTTGNPKKLSAQKVAAQNSGITRDSNGFITNRSFEIHCAKFRPSASTLPIG